MAKEFTAQYRPATQHRTQTDDAVDVALLRDMADGANNAKAHVFGPVWSDAWPQASSTGGSASDASVCVSDATLTTEEVVLLMAPIWVPFGWNRAVWTVNGRMEDSAGSGTCTWRLYAAERLYSGDKTLSTADKGLMGINSSSAITISNDTGLNNYTSTLVLPTFPLKRTFYVLTAQNNTSGIQSWLTSLTASVKWI